MGERGGVTGRLAAAIGGVLALAAAGFVGFVIGGPPASGALPAPEEGQVVEVGVLTVSLPGPEPHYARVGLAVVLEAGAVEEEVALRFPLLKDAALITIAGFEPAELRSREGLVRLRTSLTERAREIYPDGEVMRVVLVEAIVQ